MSERKKPQHYADKKTRMLIVGPEEGREATGSVIFLHGYGDTAAGWADAAFWWAERLPHLRFVLPTAPIRTSNPRVPSWSDQKDPRNSAHIVRELFDKESERVGQGRVVLAGFSQGGMMSMYLAMSRARGSPLGGVVALSSFAFRGERIFPDGPTSLEGVPVFIAHGTHDEVVPPRAAESTAALAKELGATVTFKLYE
eukprot:Sspe_Gene.53005::Locus_29335_Transcript_1_1_Confidence_1.000_Length_1435::g.53005::m.53005/K06128/LYPLA1; lysophospholipase I